MKRFLVLLSLQALFRVSFGLIAVAIPALAALDETATAQVMSYISMAKAIPYVLLAPAFGRLADTVDRRAILIAAQVMSSLAALSISWLFFASNVELRLFIVVSLLFGALSVALDVALTGSLSVEVIAKGNSRLNGWVQTINSLADILSAIAAGLILSAISGFAVFLVAGCALAIAFLTTLAGVTKSEALPHGAGNRPSRASLGQALVAIAAYPRLRILVGAMALWNGLHSAMMSLIALFVVRELGLSISTIGYMFASTGAGMLLGGVMSTKLSGAYRSSRAVGATLVVAAACWNLVAHLSRGQTSNIDLLALFCAFGCAMSLCMVAASTMRQSEYASSEQATLGAVQMWFSWTAMAIGFFAGGIFGDQVGVGEAVKVIGLLMFVPATALLASLWKSPSGRQSATESVA